MQVVHDPPSSLHWYVSAAAADRLSVPEKVKAGLAAFVGSPGLVPIEVSGAVRSTVTGTMSVVAWPTESVATASSQYEPSAGSVQETL